MSVLPQLLTVLDLRLEKFAELLVVVLQLLVAKSLPQDVLSVRLRSHLALLGVVVSWLSQVGENKGSEVLDIIHILHQGFVVLLHERLGLGLAVEHVFDRSQVEGLRAGSLQSHANFRVAVLSQQLMQAFVLQLGERHQGKQFKVLVGFLTRRKRLVLNRNIELFLDKLLQLLLDRLLVLA